MDIIGINGIQYQLPQLNTNCTRCPELVKSRKRITYGYGNPKSKVVFIGEAPGMNGCDKTGIPFTGDPSGEYFQQMLGLVGWTKDDVYTTNIVKCCPPNNRTPTEFETMQCALYLEAELSFIKPRYMILMGHTAQLHFHPKVGAVISAWDRHYVVSPERTDICIPHSSFVVRARDQWENLYLRSFNKIKELVSKEG